MYKDATVDNPSWVHRFSHGRRFDIALELLALSEGDEFLDYGAGDGYLVGRVLRAERRPRRIVAFEPVASQADQMGTWLAGLDLSGVTLARDLRHVSGRFSRISCLEVLEHMTEANQQAILADLGRRLAPGGRLVVSVPIEVGVAGFLKNLARALVHQLHGDMTFGKALRALLGLPISRSEAAYIETHTGFDHRHLQRLFAPAGFVVRRRRFSPLRGWGGLCNSQVFYVLQRAQEASAAPHGLARLETGAP